MLIAVVVLLGLILPSRSVRFHSMSYTRPPKRETCSPYLYQSETRISTFQLAISFSVFRSFEAFLPLS